MELEAKISDNSIKDCYPYKLEGEDTIVLNPEKIIRGIIEDIKNGETASIISAKFHNSIARSSIDICIRLRDRFNINETVLSGGVFQNAYLLQNMIEGLEAKGFTVYTHSLVPSNDGGASLGQLIAANEIIKASTSK
jgi:Hydrogenase maturation factor